MAEISNVTKPLTEAQRELMDWYFANYRLLSADNENEIYRILSDIGQIRQKIEAIEKDKSLWCGGFKFT